MDLITKAETFAIKAHDGQVRKGQIKGLEPIPYIVHPLDVAKTLKKYGFNDNVISGGYLHDVVEDTKYTLEDIEKNFEIEIASLVKGATEEDKSLSWEERKQRTIDKTKSLDLKHKAIVCCDKICNLQDMAILFGKIGYVNFDSFKRGTNEQKWYYDNIYKSLIYNQDENLEMFKELKNLITLIFEKTTSFKEDYISILKYKKLELQKLKKIFNCEYPNIDQITINNKDGNIIQNIECILNSANIELTGISNKDSYVYNYQPLDITDSIQAAKAIIDSLMNELYDETLTEVKRKIKEKTK